MVDLVRSTATATPGHSSVLTRRAVRSSESFVPSDFQSSQHYHSVALTAQCVLRLYAVFNRPSGTSRRQQRNLGRTIIECATTGFALLLKARIWVPQQFSIQRVDTNSWHPLMHVALSNGMSQVVRKRSKPKASG